MPTAVLHVSSRGTQCLPTRATVAAALLLTMFALAGCAGPTARAPVVSASGLIAVSGGELYYSSEGVGPALVLVNGGGMDLRQWDEQAQALARFFRVIRYDPRGWGRSPTPEGPYSPAEDLHQLLEVLGVSRASVLGVSWGGGVAIDFALSHPDEVGALVLIGPTLGGFPWSPEYLARQQRLIETALGSSPDELADLLLSDPYFVPAARQLPALQRKVRTLVAENVRMFQMDPRLAQRPATPAIERLDELKAPTLLIVPGRLPQDLVKLAALLANRLRAAQREVVRGGGHMLHLDQPVVFGELVVPFLLKNGHGPEGNR
jgi:3-oxoadipate enol-lactonase